MADRGSGSGLCTLRCWAEMRTTSYQAGMRTIGFQTWSGGVVRMRVRGGILPWWAEVLAPSCV